MGGKSKKQNKKERIADFEAVVTEYQEALLRYATRLVWCQDAAQDTVQNVFIKLYKSSDVELLPSPRLSSWLYRVTHNCAVDYIRKESRRRNLHKKQAEEQVDHVAPDRGEGFKVSEKALKAKNALEHLSEREQQLVILKIYEEKSYREISDITGLTTGNVGYILHHAMKKMAQELKRAKSDER
ncbi:hypothetical protein BVX94_01875 [bacterium B17]|nr:hypothetical protein BVX94_01875 [bacterium B17]